MLHGWIPPERYFAYLTWTDVRDLADNIVANRHTELPGEVFGKTLGRGKKLFERWALVDFALAAVFIASTTAQILVEKGGDVELCKWAGGFDLGNFFSLGFQEGFGAVILGDHRVIRQFFQHRVFDHFLVDHLTQFETIQRENAHHLNQARREDLLLRDPEVKFWRQPVHGSQFNRK